MGEGIVWDVDPEYAIVAIYDEWYAWALNAIETIVNFYAPQIEAWMKQEAIWTDRTGNLRQSLFAYVVRDAQVYSILIGYGMNYGDALMTLNQGEYDIIAPALDYFRPKIFADIRAVFRD